MATDRGGAALGAVLARLAALEDENAALRGELAALGATPPAAEPPAVAGAAGAAEAAEAAAWFDRQLEPLRLLAELALPTAVGMSLATGGRRFEITVRKLPGGGYAWRVDEVGPRTRLGARNTSREASGWASPPAARYGDPVEAFDAALARIAEVLLPGAPDGEPGLPVGAMARGE